LIIISEEVKCPNCGTPVLKSLEGSLETLVKGYVYCKGCRTRINIEGDLPKKLDKSIKEFSKTIDKINKRLKF